MIENILPNLYRVVVPLPGNPLKATNSYFILGNGRNLIVDTGMNRSECMAAMVEALDQLNVDLSITDFFITHMHVDHLGLVAKLATKTSRIFFNRPDTEVIMNTHIWDDMLLMAQKHGFSSDQLRNAIINHPGKKFSPETGVDLVMLKEGDTLEVGDYRFRCVETPGHTWGHTCLYEAEKKIFISGDHILTDITPNISSWEVGEGQLRVYLSSLDKVYELDIDLVLPGHRSLIYNCRQRIEELKDHHNDRLRETVDILHDSGSWNNAFQIAAKMNWDIVSDSWDKFPLMQKWFATGEAIAHLNYLVEEGLAQKTEQNGNIVYRGK